MRCDSERHCDGDGDPRADRGGDARLLISSPARRQFPDHMSREPSRGPHYLFSSVATPVTMSTPASVAMRVLRAAFPLARAARLHASAAAVAPRARGLITIAARGMPNGMSSVIFFFTSNARASIV